MKKEKPRFFFPSFQHKIPIVICLIFLQKSEKVKVPSVESFQIYGSIRSEVSGYIVARVSNNQIMSQMVLPFSLSRSLSSRSYTKLCNGIKNINRIVLVSGQ